jgi:hypothetical protein
VRTRRSGLPRHASSTSATLEPAPSGIVYKEGTDSGTCSKFELQKVAFTDKSSTLGKGVEYICSVQGAELVVRPEFGEIDEISFDKGKFDNRDGMHFDQKSLEVAPPINQITATDDEGGIVGTISETAAGATWRAGEQTGSCEKWKRTRTSDH